MSKPRPTLGARVARAPGRVRRRCYPARAAIRGGSTNWNRSSGWELKDAHRVAELGNLSA